MDIVMSQKAVYNEKKDFSRQRQGFILKGQHEHNYFTFSQHLIKAQVLWYIDVIVVLTLWTSAHVISLLNSFQYILESSLCQTTEDLHFFSLYFSSGNICVRELEGGNLLSVLLDVKDLQLIYVIHILTTTTKE